MPDIRPELIEKARARLAKTFGCLPTRSGFCAEHGGTMHGVSCDVPTDVLRDVLEIVADDLRAEGAERALRAYAGRVRTELDATALYGIPLGEKYLEGMYSALRQAEDAAAQYANERADQIERGEQP